ncbi:MAG TPA: hypothetical protein VKF62_07975, partial [Planctomycetota bacterium]|nr:hypothetical protein [Planctomycetota bacterium]
SPVTASVGPAGTLVTLGPLAVPVTAVVPFPTRLKISFGSQGSQTAGMAFTFGEVEDYLLPEQTSSCGGCNTTGGSPGALAATTAANLGGTLTLVTNGNASTNVVTVFGRFAGPGADISALGVPVPPGVCFLCVLPSLIFGGGTTNASGTLVQTFPVPNDLSFTGVDVNFQNFQILVGASLDVVNTNSLSTTVLP